MQRFFFDTSFTRTQEGAVGITRTVRRLMEHLRDAVAPDAECIPVAFHSQGFRLAASQTSAAAEKPLQGQRPLGARLLRRLMASPLRRRITDAVPNQALVAAWRIYSRWTFDGLASHLPPARFGPGDILLLCDASWNYQAWVATRAAQGAGARVVLMVHDLIPLQYPAFAGAVLSSTFDRWLCEMITSADAIVCNSASTKEDLQAHARQRGWALPPVSHFRLGSDIASVAPSSPPRAELLRMTAGEVPCFAAVGSIEPRKNYGLLLQAFEKLWADGEEVRLVLIGRRTAQCGDLADALAAHPEKGRRLLWLLDASDGEVNHVYSACRALVFPSLAEGFGLPLVEARSRGALVIASDIPVFRELADEGVFLFSPQSAEQLAHHVRELTRSQQGMRIAPMPVFTWSDSARQLVAVARGLLAGART